MTKKRKRWKTQTGNNLAGIIKKRATKNNIWKHSLTPNKTWWTDPITHGIKRLSEIEMWIIWKYVGQGWTWDLIIAILIIWNSK